MFLPSFSSLLQFPTVVMALKIKTIYNHRITKRYEYELSALVNVHLIRRLSLFIRVKRNTGWQGSGTNLKIYANGEKIASVAHRHEVEIKIPYEQVQLKAMQFGLRSNALTVSDGDLVEVTSSIWSRWSLPVLLILFTFPILLPDTQEKLMISALLGILFITLLLLFVKGFQLTVLPTEESL